MTRERTQKAESPMNLRGYGHRSTLENGPYFKEDVQYVEPADNYWYRYCGACAFYSAGNCVALEEDVSILGWCELYIDMARELDLRHQSYILQLVHQSDEPVEVKPEDLEVLAVAEKYISKVNGQYCVRSHQTGKNFGCYDTKAKAEARLKQISRFKEEEYEVKFAAMDEDRKIVYGIVLEPDEIDTHGDTITRDEIEKAAHKYMTNPMVIGDGHTKKAKANPIESFVYNPDVLKEVKEGSWVMAVKVHSDTLWEGVKNGDYTGFSIGAFVRKVPVDDEAE